MSGKRPSTTTSAAVIADNDDILMEILLLLPAKPVMRFKCVSKHWHSLISNAYFCHLHMLRHRKPQTSFLLRASRSQFFYFDPNTKKFGPFRFNFAQAKIRQSCHGLLLLECGYYVYKDYYVYNPSTGESRNLLPNKKGLFRGLHLAFHPSKSPHYKVVCLRVNLDYRFEVEVYDSETHTWKREEKVYSNPPPALCDGVYWENCIFSLTSDGRVFCFDIEKAMFRMPPLKIFSIRRQTGGEKMFSLMESGGHVHYIAYDDIMNYLVVYEITEKGGSLKDMVNFDYITAPLVKF